MDRPPPPPPPNGDGGFTAPPLWERGHPVEPRAMKFTDILDTAFNLYRLHWKSLMGLVALLVVPLQFLQEFLTRNYRHAAFLGTRVGENQAARVALIGLAILGLSLFIVQPLLVAAITRAVAGFHLGETPTAGDVLEHGLPLLGPVLVVILLYILVVLGGFLLLIVPGLIFFVRFLFGTSVVVVEGLRGREALRRSWALTKGNGWRVVGIVFVAGLFAAVVGAVIGAIGQAVATNAGSAAWFVRAVAGSAGAVVTTPFTQAVTVLLYFDLRVRHDGLNLERLRAELHGGFRS